MLLCQRNISFFALLSSPRTLRTKAALSLPRHLRPFALFRPATHTAERTARLYKNAVVFCHVTHKQQIHGELEGNQRSFSGNWDLLFHQQSLWERRRSDSSSKVMVLCETKSPRSGKQVAFENTYWSLI